MSNRSKNYREASYRVRIFGRDERVPSRYQARDSSVFSERVWRDQAGREQQARGIGGERRHTAT